jgi:hypothetical protein
MVSVASLSLSAEKFLRNVPCQVFKAFSAAKTVDITGNPVNADGIAGLSVLKALTILR